MRYVYKVAEQTLVWLGEDDVTVSVVEELATAMSRRDDVAFRPAKAERRSRMFKLSSRLDGKSVTTCLGHMNSPGNLNLHLDYLPPLDSRCWNALARFLLRLGLRRVWFKY